MKILPIINYRQNISFGNLSNSNLIISHSKHNFDTVTFGKAQENSNLSLSQIKWLNSQTSKFPEDLNYRKTLAAAVGLLPSEQYLLQSIMGASEFKDAVSKLKEENYMPGIRKYPGIIDTHDLSNMKSGKFRANLHNHSVHSDGKLTIEKMLELGAEIADNNKKKFGITSKVKNAPFILGITDHDTIDGTKKALEIIKKDPWKYRNLKIVLGTEITAIGTSFDNQRKPISIHTLFYNLNPYDEDLNAFLDEKKEGKKQLIQETINELNNSDLFENKNTKIKFSTEELDKFYQMPKKGLGEIYTAVKRYAEVKLIFNYLTSYDGKFMRTLDKLNFEPDDFKLCDLLEFQKNNKINTGRFLSFDKTFNEYINILMQDKAKKHGRIHDHKDYIGTLPSELNYALQKVKKICTHVEPNLKQLDEAYASFDETLEFLSQQEFGEIGAAHPAKLCVKNTNSEIGDFFREFCGKLKEHGRDKAQYYEEYYKSYDQTKATPTYLAAKYAGVEAGFLPTGGTDSHGDNIWSRRKLREDL